MLATLILLAQTVVLQAAEQNVSSRFFTQHCIDCHSGDAPEANVNLETLKLPQPGDSPESAQIWTKIVDLIETGEMPPPEEEAPPADAIREFVGDVAAALAAHETAPPLGLRRMNRREYENTIRDLLHVDVDVMNLLPEDGSVQGFDNVANGLSFSSILLERYLEAANVAFDGVIRRIQPLPSETRRLKLIDNKDNMSSVKEHKGGVISLDDSFIKFTPGWPPARLDEANPIESGLYRCRIAVWPHDPSDRTLAIGVYVGSTFGPDARKFIGNFDVQGTPQEPRIIEFETTFQAQHTIHLEPRIWPEHVTWRDKHEPRPGIAIMWAEVEGPLDQDFPSQSQQQLFGVSESITMKPDHRIWMRHRKNVDSHVVESSQPEVDAERIIREFVPRALRRPVSEEKLASYVELTLDRLAQGRTFEQAVRAGVTAVLCSPDFLLINQQAEVDDYAIASRMSYFFWSSMPDDELLQLAAEGKLRDPQVRRAQAERMIADPKISRFVENYTGQWLDQRDIEFTTPDKQLYPEFDPLLQAAMLGETRHFFTHMLQEDLSVTNFVDSDWTYLNERLARHYGIPGVIGHEDFELVPLPDDSIRGGVLAQASVLKVTANGTNTSPVLRGVWVLEHLLARPPSPPPTGVPAVEPDIRGATTIREQLEKHRANAACASCHRRIDPPGYALEAFDAIGGERSWYRSIGEGKKIAGVNYRQGPDVEPASTLPDGRPFDDFRQFRQLLLADQDQIARAATTNLLVYATGKPISLAQRAEIDQIVAQAKKNNHGLQSIIQAIVASDLFLQP